MSTKYPVQIDTTVELPTTTGSTPVTGDSVNILRDAIIAVETELGVHPAGIYGTVRARLDALETAFVSGGGVVFGNDISGSATSQTVVGIRNIPVSVTIPTAGQTLIYDGSQWTPQTISTTNPNIALNWYIDPVNGNDANSGTMIGSPLKTAKQRKKLWGDNPLPQFGTTVTYLNSQPNTLDPDDYGGIAGGSVTVIGQQLTLLSGNVTTLQAPVRTRGPTARPYLLTDNSKTTSFWTTYVGKQVVFYDNTVTEIGRATIVKDSGDGSAWLTRPLVPNPIGDAPLANIAHAAMTLSSAVTYRIVDYSNVFFGKLEYNVYQGQDDNNQTNYLKLYHIHRMTGSNGEGTNLIANPGAFIYIAECIIDDFTTIDNSTGLGIGLENCSVTNGIASEQPQSSFIYACYVAGFIESTGGSLTIDGDTVTMNGAILAIQGTAIGWWMHFGPTIDIGQDGFVAIETQLDPNGGCGLSGYVSSGYGISIEPFAHVQIEGDASNVITLTGASGDFIWNGEGAPDIPQTTFQSYAANTGRIIDGTPNSWSNVKALGGYAGRKEIGAEIVSSGNTPWSPALNTAIYAWYHADYGIVLDGTNHVQQWNDQSGNGHNLTQASSGFRPSYTTLGGLPRLVYTSARSLQANVTGITSPIEYFVIARSSSSNNTQNSYLVDFGGTGSTYQMANTNTMVALDGDPSISISIPVGTIDFYINTVINAGSTSITCNETTIAGNSGQGTGLGNTITIGNSQANALSIIGEGWLGWIYEVIIFSRQLTTAERDQVISYIYGKYGKLSGTGVPQITPTNHVIAPNWYIDPVNGNDNNSGTTQTAPLKTAARRKELWGIGGRITQQTTITYLNSQPNTSDPDDYNDFIIEKGGSVVVQGQQIQLLTGSVTAIHLPVKTVGPSAAPWILVDSSRANGFWDTYAGKQIVFNDGATAFIIKDVGATSIYGQGSAWMSRPVPGITPANATAWPHGSDSLVGITNYTIYDFSQATISSVYSKATWDVFDQDNSFVMLYHLRITGDSTALVTEKFGSLLVMECMFDSRVDLACLHEDSAIVENCYIPNITVAGTNTCALLGVVSSDIKLIGGTCSFDADTISLGTFIIAPYGCGIGLVQHYSNEPFRIEDFAVVAVEVQFDPSATWCLSGYVTGSPGITVLSNSKFKYDGPWSSAITLSGSSGSLEVLNDVTRPMLLGTSIIATPNGIIPTADLDNTINGLIKSGSAGFVGPTLDIASAGTLTVGAATATQVSVGNTSAYNNLIGGLTYSFVTKIANYTVVNTDRVILADSTGGAFAVTLPSSPVTGHCVEIKDSGGTAATNNITIAGNGKNIDGAGSFILSVNYESAKLIYNGTAWFKL